jgi:hypothetical protein
MRRPEAAREVRMTAGATARGLVSGTALALAARLGPSDRWLSTGLLAYVPAPLLAAACLAALILLRREGGPARSWRAAALALAVAAAALVLAENRRLLVSRAAPPPGRGVTVFHWNVGRNPSVAPHLARVEADVLALSEPRRVSLAGVPEGWAVWDEANLRLISRYPLDRRAVWYGRRAQGLHAVVRSDPPLSLLLVDVAAGPHVSRWQALGSLLAALPGMDPTPDVILGDLNTPVHAASLGRVLAAGYRDVYLERGAGLAYTWPSYLPLMRIDHMLVGRGVRVLGHASGFSWRSDHRWQRVELGAATGMAPPAE